MNFDVVVCTKNSALTLGACLNALFSSDIPIANVFIIDKNSEDGTIEIGEKYGCTIVSNDMGLAEARRYGVLQCNTEYFITLDSDIIIPPNFYTKLRPHIKNNFITKGIYINVLPERHRKIAERDYNWMLKNVGSLDCCIIHRDTFLRLSREWIKKGMDALEDTELFQTCEKNNIPVHQDIGVVSKHYVFSIIKVWRQTSWYAKGTRSAKIRGRIFKNYPRLFPIEILGFPFMGLMEAIRWRSWKLLAYQTAKMLYWFKGFLASSTHL